MNNTRLLLVHALSPLHAGTGQGVGVIDLPIAREKATDLPFLPGSSIKGTLRAAGDEKLREQVFGPETVEADKFAGATQFTDGRLLLLPVRSLVGTFAWVTSPYLLRRFARDAAEAQELPALPQGIPAAAQVGQCGVVQSGCALTLAGSARQVVLEDLELSAQSDATIDGWAKWLATCLFPNDSEWQQQLQARLCVVHDDVLSFLLSTATEITTRIRLLEETKTVKKGGLWYEEALPTETVLAGLVVATPPVRNGIAVGDVFSEIRRLTAGTLQFGGKATVGRGLCRTVLVEGSADHANS